MKISKFPGIKPNFISREGVTHCRSDLSRVKKRRFVIEVILKINHFDSTARFEKVPAGRLEFKVC